MPYSKKYNTLFIHIPKNAGSSICDFLDIKKLDYSKLLANTEIKKKYHNNAFFAKNLVTGAFLTPCEQHLYPSEIYERFERANKILFYDSLYKFTIIRNPYDRLISCYDFFLKNLNSIYVPSNSNIIINPPSSMDEINTFYKFLLFVKRLHDFPEQTAISYHLPIYNIFRHQIDYFFYSKIKYNYESELHKKEQHKTNRFHYKDNHDFVIFPNVPFLYKNKVHYNMILEYEKLEEQFPKLIEELEQHNNCFMDIHDFNQVPKHNSSNLSDEIKLLIEEKQIKSESEKRKVIRDYYYLNPENKGSRELVELLYRDDILYFGYKF